ncbi:MAG: OTU domain-containing protein, partial [Gloeomargaritales cyanobacterium]
MNASTIVYDGIQHGSKCFRFLDVAGDGNCLFHAIIRSNMLNIKCYKVLRITTMEGIRQMYNQGNAFVDKLYLACRARKFLGLTLPAYLDQQSHNGEWGADLDMCFISMIHGINILSISNLRGGFAEFDVSAFFKDTMKETDFLPLGKRTVWIYHHSFLQPYLPTQLANHFGSLWPVDGRAHGLMLFTGDGTRVEIEDVVETIDVGVEIIEESSSVTLDNSYCIISDNGKSQQGIDTTETKRPVVIPPIGTSIGERLPEAEETYTRKNDKKYKKFKQVLERGYMKDMKPITRLVHEQKEKLLQAIIMEQNGGGAF